MVVAKTDFPPLRACIFDMDGLLINSEDMITKTLNELLEKHKRPVLEPEIRSQLMGVPNSSNSDMFHDWAQLPISREEFAQESRELMRRHFTDSTPLPGAVEIVSSLSLACNTFLQANIELAVASTSSIESYNKKTTRPETRELLDMFATDRRILGNDSRVPSDRKKPYPDIYLVALSAINATRPANTEAIKPEECLAIEDSVAGVEAARRAGMRVVWVPHPELIDGNDPGRQEKVLAGRSGMFFIGDEPQLGQVADGWGECIRSLNDFDYEKYGIVRVIKAVQ